MSRYFRWDSRVVVSSGPVAEFLAVIEYPVINNELTIVYKFGLNLSLLNFERCDIAGAVETNFLGKVGVSKSIDQKSEILLTFGASYPAKKITIDDAAGLKMRIYPKINLTLSWMFYL